MLTDKQQKIFDELSQDTNGYGNGHSFYMITNIKDKQFGTLLEVLQDYEDTQKELICSLRKHKKAVSFHTHEKYYLGELSQLLSSLFSDTLVYYNNCWDNEGLMTICKNGEEIEPKDVCTIKINLDEKSDADDDYFAIEAKVTDNKTKESFYMGGGMLSSDDRDMILALV